MRNITIILLIVILATAGIAQTCANGREKKGIFDDVCANAYFLNGDSCCADTFVTTSYWIVIDSLDSLPIPWPWPDSICPTCPPCTVIVAAETLVINVFDTLIVYDTLVIDSSSVDTLWIIGGNGVWFYTDKYYVCDSVPTSFAADSSESTWCPWCDSVMTVTWFQVTEEGDSIIYDVWRQILISDGDTCGIVQNAGDVYNYRIVYCYGCDINIYVSQYYTYNIYDSGIYVVDSVTGITYGPTDTVWLHEYGASGVGNNGGGMWVEDCDCDTSSPTYSIPDSLDAFLAIDETWDVFWGWRTKSDGSRWDCADPNIVSIGSLHCAIYCDKGPEPAAGVKLFNHGGYVTDVIDTVDDLWGRDDTLYWKGGYVAARQVFYCDGDTTGDAGVWGRLSSHYADCGDFNKEEPICDGLARAFFMRYERVINFRDWYSDAQVAVFNEERPDWFAVTYNDDFEPWMSLNGTVATLDTLPTTPERVAAGSHIYRITPPSDFDYSASNKIIVAVYSCRADYIGAQTLFSLIMPDTISSCVSWEDTIMRPVCDDCDDIDSVHYPQGWNWNWDNTWYGDTTLYCDSYLDLTGVEALIQGAFRTVWMVDSARGDTLQIKVFPDSLVITDLDADGDPIIIHPRTEFSDTIVVPKLKTVDLYPNVGQSIINHGDLNVQGFLDLDSIAENNTTDTILVWQGNGTVGWVHKDSLLATNWDTLGAYKDTTAWSDPIFTGILNSDTVTADFYRGTDATGADSFWIYDDGDTVRFAADNPIKVGNNSLVISETESRFGGDVIISGGDTIFTDLIFPANGHTQIGTAGDTMQVYGDLLDITAPVLSSDTIFGYFALYSDSSAIGGSSPWDDSTTFIMLNSPIGLFMYGNVGWGTHDSTHVNLGVACTTSRSGSNYRYATVSGGLHNAAREEYATVGGGQANKADDRWSVVGGGRENIAGTNYATVSGGYSNNAGTQTEPTIGGGNNNTASGRAATIAGGMNNTASGNYGSIPGGYACSNAGENSFTTGYNNYMSGAADYSFLAGVFDSCLVDSTFMVGRKMHTEIRGGLRIGSTGSDDEVSRLYFVADTLMIVVGDSIFKYVRDAAE